MKYVRNLANADDKVYSVSPQVGKENRPFVGILVVNDNKAYCVPLSSPKAKHENMKNDRDFTKIFDKNNQLIGVLNFNCMIPVADCVLMPVDMVIRKNDNRKDRAYKALLNNQLDYCNANKDAIEKKANRLYKIITESPDTMKGLTKRCCNFRTLETVLEKWMESTQMDPK